MRVASASGTFTAVKAGAAHSLALRSDGRVLAWGLNANGELGDGTTTGRVTPVLVTGVTTARAIAAGGGHGLALRADGRVVAWGLNSEGQLGDGSTTRRLTPVVVSGVTDVVAIAAGGAHSLALTRDGSLWAWGSNATGQLGDGSSTTRRTPVRLASLTGVTAIAAGGAHTLALTADGRTWSWGSNTVGQLGDGTTSTRRVPVRVVGMPSAATVSAGALHSLATTTTGTLFAWGGNISAALGDGTTTTRLTPTAIGTPTAVSEVAAGGAHSLVLTTDGTAWAAGTNLFGQLGIGSTSASLVFTPLSSPTQTWGVYPPTVTPASGTADAPITITASTPTAGAVIRYTTNGTDPTETASVLPSAGLTIAQTTALRVRAFKAGMTPSAVVSADYVFAVRTPTIAPPSGTYTTAQTVSLATTTLEATITYTLDGTVPTPQSTPYVAPFLVDTVVLVSARAFRTGWTPSGVATAAYTFEFGTLPTPTAAPGAGTYSTPQQVALTAQAGARVHYTLDGSDPTETSPVFATPIAIVATTTLKARAFQSHWTPSPILTTTYVIETGGEPLPPDPATIAPPNDPTVATDFGASMAFLYSGSNPVQRGVTPDVIEPERTAVIRGRVLTRAGAPIPGVRITVVDRPAFGYTLSRADGVFDLAVNAGASLTLAYQKDGYLALQRTRQPEWQTFDLVDDVRLTALDPQATAVDFAAGPGVRVARGTPQTDAAGTRQATLIVPDTGVRADVHLPDGSTWPSVARLTLRATEYTVGPAGPQAMPASLPPSSGYTYAVELSADEAEQAGATTVTFDPPLAFYVENYLDFPVGTPVPVGYYDRWQAAWIPSPNGRVVRKLGVTDGLADVDLDGDGAPNAAAELAALGITDGERRQLALLYADGQSLWRAPIAHFSPIDLNWAFIELDDFLGGSPNPQAENVAQDTTSVTDTIDGATKRCGSIIDCQNQSLGEVLPVSGTRLGLAYQSSRAPGRRTQANGTLRLTGARVPLALRGVRVSWNVAGRTVVQHVLAQPNQRVAPTWDGTDAYGRPVYGRVVAQAHVQYDWDAAYLASESLAAALFALPGTGDPLRNTLTPWTQEFRRTLSIPGLVPPGAFGGWTLSGHHVLDPRGGVVYRGDGEEMRAIGWGLTLDAVPPFQAFGVGHPMPDGHFYLFDDVAGRLVRVRPNGAREFLAGLPPEERFTRGTVAAGPAGDVYYAALVDSGGVSSASAARTVRAASVLAAASDPLTAFHIGRYRPDGSHELVVALPTEAGAVPGHTLVVAPDRTLYVGTAAGLLRIDPAGQQLLVRPLVSGGSSRRMIGGLDLSPDGTLYWSEYDADLSSIPLAGAIYRQTPTGRVDRLAGTGVPGEAADGTLAVDAPVSPLRLALAPDGSLVFLDTPIGSDGFRQSLVRRITPDGVLTTLAGGGMRVGAVGIPARAASLAFHGQSLLVVGPDRRVYLDNWGRLVRLSLGAWSATGPAYFVPSPDGAEVYEFSREGRHLRTRDAVTGVTVATFSYDAAGRLTSLTDRDGHVTTIQRDGTGVPTAIRAPFGQQTTLTMDANGYLATVADPGGHTARLVTRADGLLQEFRDPNGQASTFAYDALGRLARDTDAAGGTQAVSRIETPSGWTATISTGLGRTTRYAVDRLDSGAQVRTTTAPDGTVQVTTERPDGAQVIRSADGTQTTVTSGPDPRFGTAVPVPVETVTTLPSGVTRQQATFRSVALANPDDPLSVSELFETSTVNGQMAMSVYDATTRTVTTTTPMGRQSTRTLDAQGRVTRMQAGTLTPVQFDYDAQGRLASVTQGTRNLTYAYTARGELASLTDGLNRAVTFGYDAASRVTSQTRPDSESVAFGYDAASNVTSITPPGRTAHQFAVTPVNLLDTYTPPAVPGGGATTYAYNTDRQPTSETRPDGQPITLTYDAGGRPASVTSPSTGTVQYGYLSTGQLGTITAPGSTLTYSYDGPLPTSEQWTGTVGGNVTWTFNNNFQVTAEQVSGTPNVAFDYDADGLLTSAGALTLTREVANGLVTAATVGASETTYSYDAFGVVQTKQTTQGGTPIFGVSYTRDALGRIASKTETVLGTTTTDGYTYDLAGRLTTVTRNGTPVETYTYDANGNRLTATTSAGAMAATYDAQDRLRTYGTATFTYAAAGELLTKTVPGTGATTYQHDAMGNLRAVTLPTGTVVSYAIDGANRRIARAVNGTVTHRFLYQGQLRPVAEVDASGAVISRFVYGTGINVPDYMVRGGTTYRFLTDHLGSVRLVVDTVSGAIAQRLEYDTIGVVTTDTNPGFQPFGFAGGLYDPPTGLVRFGRRDYDAALGRWTQRDPVRFAGGDSDLYAYVSGDPVNRIDPVGLDWQSDAADFAAGFGDAITSLGGITKMFGLPSGTEFVRQQLSWNGQSFDSAVDRCSTAYSVGEVAGTLHGMALGGAGSLNGGARSVFWSGGRAAYDEAVLLGGVTIRETIGGRALLKIEQVAGTDLPKVVWDGASAVFAANAKGVASVVEKSVDPNSTFRRIERPVAAFLGAAVKSR